MTKKNIVQSIAEELDLPQLETKEIVQKTLDAIIDVLAVEGRVELRNFGVFKVRKRKPRQARNPRTGEKVMVGERFTVKFKPGRRSRSGSLWNAVLGRCRSSCSARTPTQSNCNLVPNALSASLTVSSASNAYPINPSAATSTPHHSEEVVSIQPPESP